MEKTIFVKYQPFGDVTEMQIPVCYQADEGDHVLTLQCRVDLPLAKIPWWLKPHKFELRASHDGDTYELLMNETRDVYTVDAALFMDKVQEKIVELERSKGSRLEHSGR